MSLRERLPIAAVMALSAFVYLWGLWNEGLGNLYYAAGVLSMGQSLHAFLFNSLDSVGFISVDKPPLGLWIQVLFTKVLGFDGPALLRPQALAGIAATYLVYRMVAKRFGRGAGLASALVLSLTPILAAVSRNNTMDGLLVLLLVLASEQAVQAAERSSPRHLVLAGVFIGLGFNVKMLASFVLVPAIYLAYLIHAKRPPVRRLLACLLSFAVLCAISLSWVVAVDLTPAADRPYVGSSGTNSELALTFGNNGIGRLLGGQGRNSPVADSRQGSPPPSGAAGGLPPPGGGPSAGGGETGPISLLRLATKQDAGQISWFLLPALLVSLCAMVQAIRRRLPPDGRTILLSFAVLGFVPMLLYFSLSNGVVHRYYFAMFALPIAGLAGIGYEWAREGEGKSRFLLPVAFLATAGAQLFIQSLYPGWLDGVLPAAAALFAAVSVVLLVRAVPASGRSRWAPLSAVLLLLPALWSITPILYGGNAQLPIAGPELIRQGDAFDRRPDLSGLVDYLEQNRGGATYLAAAASAMDLGAELILQSGEPVMVLGGFRGGDRPLTVAEFQSEVAAGVVRFAVLADRSTGRQDDPILSWIRTHGVRIDGLAQEISVYRLG